MNLVHQSEAAVVRPYHRQHVTNVTQRPEFMEYTFTLKYQLSARDGHSDSDHTELVERLGAEGCDDALVGVGQPGRIALEFVRESETAEAALVSALADVKRAIPTAKLIEVSPDFVGLTDAASRI